LAPASNTANLRAHVVKRLAAEVAKLAKDRDERVPSALPGQVVQVSQGQMRELTSAAPDLKTRRAQ
jgi:hypothetical protein